MHFRVILTIAQTCVRFHSKFAPSLDSQNYCVVIRFLVISFIYQNYWLILPTHAVNFKPKRKKDYIEINEYMKVHILIGVSKSSKSKYCYKN